MIVLGLTNFVRKIDCCYKKELVESDFWLVNKCVNAKKMPSIKQSYYPKGLFSLMLYKIVGLKPSKNFVSTTSKRTQEKIVGFSINFEIFKFLPYIKSHNFV